MNLLKIQNYIQNMAIELPKEKVKASRVSPSKLVLYSAPKVGKTTVLSQLENCLIIDCEKGSDFVDALKYQVNSLEDLYYLGEEIKKQGKPYKYLAIDTISRIEDWCVEEARKLYIATPMGANYTGNNVLTLPNGAGYLYVRISFEKWTNYIETLAENVIYIAHLKDKFVGNKKGEEVSSKDIDLIGKGKSILCSKADAIGYMYRTKDDNLSISFISDDTVVCGSRCEHLKGQEFIFDWKKIYLD